MRSRTLAAALALVALAACEPTQVELAKDGAFTPLHMQDAAEFELAMGGTGDALCLSGSAALDFTELGQMYGFLLTLSAGDTLNAATAGDPMLDTTLFLFGPGDGAGFYGEWPVAMDDDGGPLAHALLNTTIKESGKYVLIASTYGGKGFGSAGLSVTIGGAAGCGGPQETPCDDGDPCTVDGVGPDGQCQNLHLPGCGGPDFCDDGDPCTADEVLPSGECQNLPVPGCGFPDECDDGDPCTVDELGPDGQCNNLHLPGCGGPDFCDDGDPCTADEILPSGECQNLPVPGCGFPDECDDGDPCTADEILPSGECQNLPVPGCGFPDECDDGDPCTEDQMEPAIGCVHFPIDGCWGDELCDGIDNDGDGEVDEGCPPGECYDAAGVPIPCDPECGEDLDGDGIGDLCDADIDGDGIPNELDNCPSDPNPLQLDENGDGIGDACQCIDPATGAPWPCDGEVCGDGMDNNGDGQIDEGCDPSGEVCGDGIDNDMDGLVDEGCDSEGEVCGDGLDNDGDGFIDEGCVQDDIDGDGLPNGFDNCPLVPNPDQADSDGDDVGDLCDEDMDNDAIPNALDNCPLVVNPDQADANGDGLGDACE